MSTLIYIAIALLGMGAVGVVSGLPWYYWICPIIGCLLVFLVIYLSVKIDKSQ